MTTTKFPEYVPEPAKDFFKMRVEMYKTPPAIDYKNTNLAILEKIFTHELSKEFWGKMNELKISPYHFCIVFCKSLGWGYHVKGAQNVVSKAKKNEKLTLELIQNLENEYENNDVIKAGLTEVLNRSRNEIKTYKGRFDYVGTTKKDIAARVYFCKNLAKFFEISTGNPCHSLTADCATMVFEKALFTPESVSQTVNR